MIVRRYLSRTGVLLGLLLCAITAGMATIRVEVNGRAQYFSVPPRQIQNRTMVPLRGIFESLGARVEWNESQQSIIAIKGNTDVQLGIGDRRATVNRRVVYLDAPASIYRGSTMVPLRFVSEALGADVKWFDASQTVTISTGGQYYAPIATRRTANRKVCNLVASIALYPDPLLAIMLPAATYEDQIIVAERMHLNYSEIDRQNWDVSVKSLAHYPTVLRRMANDSEWTMALGQVYVEQPQVVMESIQTLRVQCRSNGVLRSTREQRIYLEGDYVRIVPAQAEMIYVPTYDANVVYVSQVSSHQSVLLSFGVGLAIGAWLSYDTDWSHNRVYCHGWQGSGWIADSRSHVTINNTYISHVGQQVIVNRAITSRQINQSRVTQYHLPSTFAQSSQSSSRQFGSSSMSSNQQHVNQMHANQMHANQMHANQVHANQVHANQVHANQAHANRAHANQMHANRVHVNQMHANRVHANQMHGSQAHGNQSHGSQARGNQSHGNQAHGNQSHGSQARGNQSHGNQAHGNQSHGSQARGNQSHGNQAHGSQARGNQSHGNQSHGNQAHGNQAHGSQGNGNQGHGNNKDNGNKHGH